MAAVLNSVGISAKTMLMWSSTGGVLVDSGDCELRAGGLEYMSEKWQTLACVMEWEKQVTILID